MQTELDAMKANPGVQILGVNEAGLESANALMCEGRDIPWLQESVAERVWGPWEVTYRDVVIVDRQNRVVSAYNLTANDLSVPANYNTLLNLLLEAAE